MSRRDDSYWSVDLHGLDEHGATEVVSFAKRELGLSGQLIDPQLSFTLHMDLDTVQTIVSALAHQSASDDGALSLLEIFQDWIELIKRSSK